MDTENTTSKVDKNAPYIQKISRLSRLHRMKKMSLIEAGIWILVLPVYIILGNWAAAIITCVILLKIYQLYITERYSVYQAELIDDMLEILNDIRKLAEDGKPTKSTRGKKK